MSDVSGYGKLPLGSRWVKQSGQLYAAPLQDIADIWNDWLFDAPTPPSDNVLFISGWVGI
jgi:hypothetical protein